MKAIDIQFLNECINFEIKISGKLCSFLCYIDHLVKPEISLKHLLIILSKLLIHSLKKKTFLIITIGDLNAKTTSWYKNETNSYDGLKNDTITSRFGLQQIINEPTYITSNSSSCIDLTFLSQPNLVMKTLYPNCHHQIVFAKIKLKIYIIHHLMHMKFGIMKRQMLTFFIDQLTNSLGISDLLT